MFRKILVATDFSPASRAALFAAVNLARKSTAQLEAIYVVPTVEEVFNASRFLVPDSEWHSHLNSAMEDFFPPNLHADSKRRILAGGSVVEEILKHATREESDLIVVGSYGRNALGRLLLGSVTQKLIETSKIPVMIVRDVPRGENVYQGYNRVLVPMDFSDISMKALNFGVRFTNFLDANLHLIHVVETEVLKEMTTRYGWPEIETSSKENWGVNLTLSKIVEPKKLNQEPIVNTLYGEAADRILEYAEVQNMDFIVMGTHGRRGSEKFLLGSVTAEVVAKSTHPVITIRG